jgi:hypothetical protein
MGNQNHIREAGRYPAVDGAVAIQLATDEHYRLLLIEPREELDDDLERDGRR